MSDCWRELQDRFPKMARVTWMHWFRAFHAALICLIAIREREQHNEIHTQATACWMSFLRIFNRIKDQNSSIGSCSRALNRLDAVLKSETGKSTQERRSSANKQIQDTSTQLLIPLNGDAGPAVGVRNPLTPPHQTIAEEAAANAGSSTAPMTFDSTKPPFVAQPQLQASFSATTSLDPQAGAALDALTAGDALNLFDLDIQNRPAWLTNDESPTF